jgi:NADH:ubiquinone oxidoreductase subunit K
MRIRVKSVEMVLWVMRIKVLGMISNRRYVVFLLLWVELMIRAIPMIALVVGVTHYT